MKKLTKRQAEYLETITTLWRRHLRPPTLEEIGRERGTDKRGAFSVVDALRRKGYVESAFDKSRTLKLVGMRVGVVKDGFIVMWR